MRNNLAPLIIALGLGACSPQMPESQGEDAAAADKRSQPAVKVDLADSEPLDADQLAALQASIAENLPGVAIDHIRSTPLPGIFEIQAGLNFGYVSADGRYLIEGDLNDLESGVALTDVRRRGVRHEMLESAGAGQSITYAPKEPAKYTVTVFTDIDCGYCRKLHEHIAEYNDEGIAVRYLFFPRSGPNTESFYKAEQVWCAADQQAALTKAKLGGGYSGKKDCSNPVMQHLQLAAELGIRGTPAIFLPDGELIPGYQTPDQLVKILEQHQLAAGPG